MDEQLLAVNKALITLLGHSNFKISDISRISLTRLKEIFRVRVKEVHPDMAVSLGRNRALLEEEFKQINEAYHFITGEIKSSKNRKIIVNPYNFNSSPRKKRQAPKGKKSGNFFYSGRLPEKELRFAEYLYYSRIINWKTLINSLTWQGRNRPRTGEIAQNFGFLNRDDLVEVIRNSLLQERLGQTAIRLNFLTREQLMKVLYKQKSYRLPIGKYFTLHNLLDIELLEKMLRENMLHNLKFK